MLASRYAGVQIMTQFIADNLSGILLGQLNRLIEIRAYQFLHITALRYRSQAKKAIEAFQWREDLAKIGLDQIALIDYRLSHDFLIRAGGIRSYITNPQKIQNLIISQTPNGLLVIQAQWGKKYQKAEQTLDLFLADSSELEQAGVLKEGLSAYIYWGKELLEKCGMEFPGSNTENGEYPTLDFAHGEVRLLEGPGYVSNDRYGCVSRGRIHESDIAA
jgi:hypothetical protein